MFAFQRRRDERNLKAAQAITSMIAKRIGLDQNLFELWVMRIYNALEQLLDNTYRKDDIAVFARVTVFKEALERVLSNPKVVARIPQNDVRLLREGFGDIIDRTNRQLDASVSPPEISLFCDMAETGRTEFKKQGLNPDDFTEQRILKLAHKIRENYPAYAETLRGLQV